MAQGVRVLTVQAWGPEFKSQPPHSQLGRHLHMLNGHKWVYMCAHTRTQGEPRRLGRDFGSSLESRFVPVLPQGDWPSTSNSFSF